MKYSYAYHTRSRFAEGVCSFAPNLEREAVAFDAPLRDPLRFREAISALHDVVVSDHRYRPRDKSEYESWKKDAGQRQRAIATAARDQARAEYAAAQNVSLGRFLSKLHDEVLMFRGEAQNFTSLLRCACLTYMAETKGKESAVQALQSEAQADFGVRYWPPAA